MVKLTRTDSAWDSKPQSKDASLPPKETDKFQNCFIIDEYRILLFTEKKILVYGKDLQKEKKILVRTINNHLDYIENTQSGFTSSSYLLGCQILKSETR